MSIETIRSLTAPQRLTLLDRLAANRYGKGGWKAMAAEMGFATVTAYRWRNAPENIPFTLLVALWALQRTDASEAADKINRAADDLRALAEAVRPVQ